MEGDYERVEAAIRYLEAHARRQPSLDELAVHLGLSAGHLQRVFRRWAGVSPKRFLQFLTARYARSLLESRSTLLEVAWEAGLSGPGRLHDLFVGIHAMTPAQVRAGGAGLTLRWGLHPTPFGMCLLGVTERGVAFLSFPDLRPGDAGPGEDDAGSPPPPALRGYWPEADFRQDRQGTARLIRQIFRFGPSADHGPLTLHLRGTNFQVRVWEALLRIPPGQVVTYGELAKAVDLPSGARAVGGAVGRNPVSWLIPCHRVIRGTGAFGDYRWGSARKKAMLGWEAARSDTGRGPASDPDQA